MAVDNFARALAAKAIAGGGAGSSSGSGVQVQADWNVNDESNPVIGSNSSISKSEHPRTLTSAPIKSPSS